MALALMSALDYVANNSVSGIDYKSYFDIPENDKLFYDVIVRKAQLSSHNPEVFNDIGIQYTEVLVSGSIVFKPKIVFVGDLKSKQGHFEIDADFKQVSHPDFEVLSNGNEIDFIMIEFTKNLLFNNNNLM